MKTLLILALVGLGSYLVDNNFTNFIGTTLILIGGLWGGYLDGIKKGKRQILTGEK